MARTVYDSRFKSKVAVEAIRGEKTVAQIASEFGIHPNLVTPNLIPFCRLSEP